MSEHDTIARRAEAVSIGVVEVAQAKLDDACLLGTPLNSGVRGCTPKPSNSGSPKDGWRGYCHAPADIDIGTHGGAGSVGGLPQR